jgi:hypothetical protein
MVRNGEHDPDHDDDQHVHRWYPNNLPHSTLQLHVNQGLSHSSNPEYGRC